MTPLRLYTLKELSDHVGRPVRSLRTAIADGLLDYHQEREGGIITVSLEQWEAYLELTMKNANAARKLPSRPRRRGAVHQKADGRKVSRRDPTAYSEITF